MKNLNIKNTIVVVLLILCGSVSWYLYYKEYRQHDTVSIHSFPNVVNGWTAEEMEITEKEYAILETRNAFARIYRSPDGKKQAYLFIVYSQNNRKVSHPPEICYTGGGQTVLDKSIRGFNLEASRKDVKANRLLMEQNGRKHISYYWFKVGNSFTANYWKQQILIAMKTLTNKPASSALIRVSAPVQRTVEQTDSDIQEFGREVISLVPQYLP